MALTDVGVQTATGETTRLIERNNAQGISGKTDQQLFEGAQRRFGVDAYPNKLTYLSGVARMSKLMEDVRKGRPHAGAALREAFSSSDFEYLFDDVLNRSLLGAYELWTNEYESFMERRTVNDFRQNYIFRRDGLRKKLPERDELAVIERDTMEDNRYAFEMKEYAKAVDISWRTYINDDLDALARVPTDLVEAMRWTESDLTSRMYLSAYNGVRRDGAGSTAGTAAAPDYHPFFNSSASYTANSETQGLHSPSIGTLDGAESVIQNLLRANSVLGTPANSRLLPSSLMAAKTQMRRQVGFNGEPIVIRGYHLILGPGLKDVADSIMNATAVVSERVGGQQGGTGQYEGFERLHHNTAGMGVVIHEDPNFDTIVGDDSVAEKMWILVADPAVASRPSFLYAKLAGYEAPRMFKESSRYELVGGGSMSEDPFYTTYICQMFFGTAHIDPRFVLLSLGTDS